MIYILIVIIIAAVYYILKNKQEKETDTTQQQKTNTNDSDFINSYKSKWLFTYHEKDAYRKIKSVTDSMGLTLLSKVRLFDLVEPRDDISNKKAAQYKIQAKHCDFVICDEKLVARIIIELDDSSHQRPDRQQRDNFVDAVLTNAGYKVLHYNDIDATQLRSDLEALTTNAGT